jgi:hypothetical protein
MEPPRQYLVNPNARLDPNVSLLIRKTDTEIYLMRYNVGNLFTVDGSNHILNNSERFFTYLNNTYFAGNSLGFIRLGNFYLDFFRNEISCCNVNITDQVFQDDVQKYTVRPDILKTLLKENKDFQDFFLLLIKKTLYELYIRSRVNGYFSIDLYANRHSSLANIFHVDSTDLLPVSFFTLTYIVPNGAIMKGVTVISREELPVGEKRHAISVSIMNGTTLGIDNRHVFHATPSTIINEPDAVPNNYIEETALVDTHRFTITRPIIPGTPNIDIESKRSFIRTWYYEMDQNNDVFPVVWSEALPYNNFTSFKLIHDTFNSNTFTIPDTRVNEIINRINHISLGGTKNIKSSPAMNLTKIKQMFDNPDINFIIYNAKQCPYRKNGGRNNPNKKSKSRRKNRSKSRTKSKSRPSLKN